MCTFTPPPLHSGQTMGIKRRGSGPVSRYQSLLRSGGGTAAGMVGRCRLAPGAYARSQFSSTSALPTTV